MSDLSEAIAASRAPALAILTYHSIDNSGSIVSMALADFAQQMGYLSEHGWLGISLREAVAFHEVNGAWPGRCVVLTFDDGYANFYECVLPVLLQYGFKATVFIIAGQMGTLNNWAPAPPGLGSLPLLSWQQAKEISALGIEVGSHTKTHPDLRQLSAEAIEDEVSASCSEIESHVGRSVESFAYPFGSFNRAASEIVRRRFRAACTTLLQRAKTDPFYALPRVDMYYIRSQQRLDQLLNGRLDHYLMTRRLGRKVRSVLPSRFFHF